MIEFKRGKKSRSKSALFNPKKILKNKNLNLKNDFQKDNLAA